MHPTGLQGTAQGIFAACAGLATIIGSFAGGAIAGALSASRDCSSSARSSASSARGSSPSRSWVPAAGGSRRRTRTPRRPDRSRREPVRHRRCMGYIISMPAVEGQPDARPPIDHLDAPGARTRASRGSHGAWPRTTPSSRSTSRCPPILRRARRSPSPGRSTSPTAQARRCRSTQGACSSASARRTVRRSRSSRDRTGRATTRATVTVPDGGLGSPVFGLAGEACVAGRGCERSDMLFRVATETRQPRARPRRGAGRSGTARHDCAGSPAAGTGARDRHHPDADRHLPRRRDHRPDPAPAGRAGRPRGGGSRSLHPWARPGHRRLTAGLSRAARGRG